MRLTLLLATLGILAAAPCAGQALVHPNEIRVTTRFTNVDPGIRTFLDAPRTWYSHLEATALGHPVPLFARSSGSSDARTFVSQPVTVETNATGIEYGVVARQMASGLRETYDFAPVRSGPVASQPAAPVDVDLAECATLVRVCFRDAAGVPVLVQRADMLAFPDPGNPVSLASPQARGAGEAITELALAVRATGSLGLVRVDFVTGADPSSDRVIDRAEFMVPFDCDAIVELGCDGGGFCNGGDGGRGRITGLFDVVGETEVSEPTLPWTRARASGGPFGNYRTDHLRDPTSGPFELENLVLSTACEPAKAYDVGVDFVVGRGRERCIGATPPMRVLVESDATIDLGDAFVMTPAVARGRIELAGPVDVPGLGAPHAHLLHADSARYDADASGLPDQETWIHAGSFTRASGLGGGESVSGLPGSTDAASGSFEGTHRLVLASPFATSRWALRSLTLKHSRTDTPADPRSYLDSIQTISDERMVFEPVPPGSVVDVENVACFGLVRVAFEATSGTLCMPRVDVAHHESPALDAWGRARPLSVTGGATGTPRWPDCASTGLVQFLLPEGRHELRASAVIPQADGSSSSTEVEPVRAKVGCRQVVDAVPGLSVSLTGLPACAGRMSVRLEASVSGARPIARAWARADGGPEVVICTDCGVEPELRATVELLDRQHEVSVHVLDDLGREAVTSDRARFTVEPSSSSTPLRVRREAGRLELTFEDVPGQLANAYRGSIASLRAGAYDHAGFGACGISGGRYETDLPEASSYFLVAGDCDWGDTILGRDSRGVPVPPALGRCP